jgi:hypothetical protein
MCSRPNSLSEKSSSKGPAGSVVGGIIGRATIKIYFFFILPKKYPDINPMIIPEK